MAVAAAAAAVQQFRRGGRELLRLSADGCGEVEVPYCLAMAGGWSSARGPNRRRTCSMTLGAGEPRRGAQGEGYGGGRGGVGARWCGDAAVLRGRGCWGLARSVVGGDVVKTRELLLVLA